MARSCRKAPCCRRWESYSMYYDLDWRFKPLKERLAFAYTNKLFTDVTICVYLGDKKNLFEAHKNILAHFSSVLEEKFYGDEGRDLSYFELTDIDPEGLAYVLRQLYYIPPSPCKNTDRSILIAAYHAAMTLRMSYFETDIKQEILDQILTHSLITRDDFWKILDLSRILKLEDITKRLLSFAESNSKEVLRAKSLAKTSPCTLMQVLDLDCLRTSEVEVLDSIVRWKKGNLALPFVDQFVKDMVGRVRFRNMSSLDLCQFSAMKSDLVRGDDVLGIMMHLGSPESIPLPAWCSTKLRRSIKPFPKDSLIVPQIKASSTISYNTKELSLEITRRGHPGLLSMYVEQKHTDACFLVGTEKRTMKAHRNILALGSMFLATSFFGSNLYRKHPMQMPTIDPKDFEIELMRYYDDSIPHTRFRSPDVECEFITEALKGLDRLSITLGGNCAKRIDNDAEKLKNFWKQLQSKKTRFVKDGYSVKQLLDYAGKYTKDVLACPDFLNASLDAVKRVLQVDTLTVKEIDVLNNVARWLEHNSKTNKTEKVKYELLSLIRFDDMSAGDFGSFMVNYGYILPKDQSLSILLHLHNKSSPLPEWCYRGPSRTFSNMPPSSFSNNQAVGLTDSLKMKLPILSKQQKSRNQTM